MTTFSDRLKEAMYAQNLKQIDLVHIAAENNVKLGKSHVSQYVSGKTVPRNDILHFLADTLHVDADWLLGDSQENFTARENNSVAPKAPSTTKTSGSVGTSNSSKRGTTPMKKTITDKMITIMQEVLPCIYSKNHPNSIMYYMMSVDRLLKKLPVWKNAVPTY